MNQFNLFGSRDGPSVAMPGGKPTKLSRSRMPFKLFFAILPDAAVASQILKLGQHLDQQFGIHGKPLRVDRLHITLQVLGEYEERPDLDIAFGCNVAQGLSAEPFDVVFDRAMTFRTRSNPYVLRVGEGSDSIEAFWRKLGIAIADVRPFKEPKFTPHMTLSYDGEHIDEHAIDPVRWTVREFVLINSHVGRTYHELVGRWPLRG